MKRQSLAVLLLLLGILFLIFWLPANRAIFTKGEVRAAIDIGSGSTNLKIAKVDPKTNKITVSLFEKSIPVAYQEELELSPTNTFDSKIMNQGIQSIKTLREIADTYHVKKVIGVATAAFRKATNASDFVQEIRDKTGVEVRIINQDEEGILAFRGAVALTAAKPEHIITWDIGGGSMQLTTLTKEGNYLVEKGKTASIPFKNAIIEKIKQQELSKVQSPNPMTEEQMEAAVIYAEQLAQESDPYFLLKIQEPQTQVFAVGSLFNFGIGRMMNHSVIYQDPLEKKVMDMRNKTDEELPGGALAEVAISNPLLVLGYMKGLELQKIHIIHVNNADGALTFPPYWIEEASSQS